MPARGPLKLPYVTGLPKLDNMKEVGKQNSRRPSIGITQGGSSRKAKGAKVAATDGQVRQSPTRGKSSG